ncbi:hypothetical protein [Amycolatopsis sp. NPDC051102]|uniref:hypothetical protein n=1 Tax=Amycolatopsis sp. NPDC051102 TaxID=3155163 RepID=UPI00341B4059
MTAAAAIVFTTGAALPPLSATWPSREQAAADVRRLIGPAELGREGIAVQLRKTPAEY